MQAIELMNALEQPTRLDVWRRLVDQLPDGLTAGDIAKAVDMSKTAMSPHFAILSATGLLSSRKIDRTVIYKAETAAADRLRTFLTGACARETPAD